MNTAYKNLQEKATISKDKKDSKPDTDYATRSKDFSVLQQENPDIYAWITVPGTSVDYPILMSGEDKDTNYYLDHNVDGSKGYPGSLYVQKEQKKDFGDFNTVVYGHNMKNGSMLATLHKYHDEAFFKEHQTITVETRDKLYTYTVYAAERFDDRLMIAYYNDNTAGHEQFIQDISKPQDMISHVNEDLTPDMTSKFITLSTCIGNEQTNRYLVIGVLTKVQEFKD